MQEEASYNYTESYSSNNSSGSNSLAIPIPSTVPFQPNSNLKEILPCSPENEPWRRWISNRPRRESLVVDDIEPEIPEGPLQDKPVPSTYRCYRCNVPGHWIKNCPVSTPCLTSNHFKLFRNKHRGAYCG